MNSNEFIKHNYCNFLQKLDNLNFFFCFKFLHFDMVCYEILQIASPLGQKCIFFILLGFDDNKLLLKYFYIFIFCPGRAFQ